MTKLNYLMHLSALLALTTTALILSHDIGYIVAEQGQVDLITVRRDR